MKFIAHKGNITGPNPSQENRVDYIKYAIEQGHGVEFDVRSFNGKLYLGHDDPQEELPLELLRLPDSFVHAKDIDAFEKLLKLNCNVFWHQTDGRPALIIHVRSNCQTAPLARHAAGLFPTDHLKQ